MQTNTATIRSNQMTSNSVNNDGIEWLIRVAAVVEVFGGLFGAGRATAIFLETRHPAASVAIIFYLACSVAGVLLWQKLLSGYLSSLLLQLAQVPWVIGTSLSYACVCGPALWLGTGTSGTVGDHTLVSWFQFGRLTGWGLTQDPQPLSIGINLIAAALVVLLVTNWPVRKRWNQRM